MRHPMLTVFGGLVALVPGVAAVAVTAGAPASLPAGAAPATRPGVVVRTAEDVTAVGALDRLADGQLVVSVRTAADRREPYAVPLADVVELKFDPAALTAATAPLPSATLTGAAIPVAAIPVAATGPAGPSPVVEPMFTSLFDGRDLSRWDGDRGVWSVTKDGTIRGKVVDAKDGAAGKYLIFRGGEYEDFVLRFKYKLVGGNAGVMYRARVADPAKRLAAGYSMELDADRKKTGANWDRADPGVDGSEAGRGLLAPQGMYQGYGDGTKKGWPINQHPPEKLAAAVADQDWNECEIEAEDDRLDHVVNSYWMSEVDDDVSGVPRRGVIALRVDAGQATEVLFKDLRIKGKAADPRTPVPVAKARPPITQPVLPAPQYGDLPLRPVPDPAEAAEGFVSLFDGSTLAGWSGSLRLWGVEDGAITGRMLKNRDDRTDTDLIWAAQEFDDFEVRLKCRLPSGDTGIHFRTKLADRRWQVAGYEADIKDDARQIGHLWDHPESGGMGGRHQIGFVGQRTTYSPDGGRRIATTLGTGARQVLAALDPAEWNEYAVTAEGSHITVSINGQPVTELVDDHPAAIKAGLLGLQLRMGNTLVQFKDIRVRPLGGKRWPTSLPAATPPPAVVAAAGGATRPAGDLWTIALVGGDRLTATVTGWDEKAVHLRAGAGPVDLPVRQLTEAWHGPADRVDRARALKEPTGLDDVAFVEADGGKVRAVRGLVRGMSADALRFRYNDQDREIALSRLVGVALGTADRAEPPDAPRQAVVLTTGDVLSGAWTGYDGGTIRLRTDWGQVLTFPVADVDKVQGRNGRIVSLPDLTPAHVEQIPYFDRILPWQANRSLTGGPLRTADGEVAKGLAVQPRTVLQYDLGGKFARLKGKVGFQLPEGKPGRALVRVSGDGRPLFERPDLRGDAPLADYDLDLAGVQRLSLEVDFGQDQDVGDRVVWVNPRLVRAK